MIKKCVRHVNRDLCDMQSPSDFILQFYRPSDNCRIRIHAQEIFDKANYYIESTEFKKDDYHLGLISK